MKISNNTKKHKQIQFTAKGFEKIQREFQKLQLDRKDAVNTLKAARELGDLSENGLYKAARGRLSSIDNSLFRLETMIKLARVEKVQKGIAGIGSSVTVFDGKKCLIYYIVGEFEADPANFRVSVNSPIGKSLLGKKAGDKLTIKIPSGILKYKIIEICEA